MPYKKIFVINKRTRKIVRVYYYNLEVEERRDAYIEFYNKNINGKYYYSNKDKTYFLKIYTYNGGKIISKVVVWIEF